MRRNLPPLNPLRFFEAAARHLSFTRAAEEMFVTQAAISHQIKSLEEYLGVRLFRRLTRRVQLTEEGQMLLPVVQRCFDQLTDVTVQVSRQVEGGTLSVMVRPFFAARWLSHRLHRFWKAHPTIELRLLYSTASNDFMRDDIDISIRWGRGQWAGIEPELLLQVDVGPLFSPKLMEGEHPIHEVDDLRHHTLLHEEDYEMWTKWLVAAGATRVKTRRGIIIDDNNVRTQVAIDGQGVALGPLSLVADDLATGRLLAPFATRLRSLGYYIIYPVDSKNRPNVTAFRNWLFAEVANDKLRTEQAAAHDVA